MGDVAPVILVTGASRGIGRAIAVQLAERGCDVALSYFNGSARADETASLVRSAGREAHVGQVDLREEAEVRRFVDEAAQHFGGVHTAIYAAGPYIPMRFIGQQPAAAFREVMEHDAFGCFHLIQAALPHLRTAKGSFTAIVTPAIRRYAVRDILSAAPKAAVADTPSTPGSASGLRNSPCITAPANPRAAPTTRAQTARGARTCHSTSAGPDVGSLKAAAY